MSPADIETLAPPAPVADFFVPGLAAPGGSKKAFAHRSTGRIIVKDDGKGNREWRATVTRFGHDAYPGPPLDGPLRVRMTFVRPRPAGHFGSGRNAARLKPSAPPYPIGRPDVLKLARAAEDALTGVLWSDDSRTVRLELAKDYGERPGLRVEVWRLEGEPAARNGAGRDGE